MKIKHDAQGPRFAHECDACKPEPQHTPTPWEAVIKGSQIYIQNREKGYTVAIIESCTDFVYSEDAANAALIVRAVNAHKMLLEALKDATRLVVECIPEDPEFPEFKKYKKDLLQAIAKAEGK